MRTVKRSARRITRCPGSGLQLAAGLRYDLTATRTAAGWRLASARVTLRWQQAAPAGV
jgi:hypothetical protein